MSVHDGQAEEVLAQGFVCAHGTAPFDGATIRPSSVAKIEVKLGLLQASFITNDTNDTYYYNATWLFFEPSNT